MWSLTWHLFIEWMYYETHSNFSITSRFTWYWPHNQCCWNLEARLWNWRGLCETELSVPLLILFTQQHHFALQHCCPTAHALLCEIEWANQDPPLRNLSGPFKIAQQCMCCCVTALLCESKVLLCDEGFLCIWDFRCIDFPVQKELSITRPHKTL